MTNISENPGYILGKFSIQCATCRSKFVVDNLGIPNMLSWFMAELRIRGWRKNSKTKRWFCGHCVKLRAHIE